MKLKALALAVLLVLLPVFGHAATYLSMVNGTAFIWDTVTDFTPYQTGNYRVTITDSAGKTAVGWISATAPGGLTLGDEKITSVGNAPGNLAYETFATSGKDITSAINTADAGTAFTNDFVLAGALFQVVADITLNSGTGPRLSRKSSGYTAAADMINPLVDGTYYFTQSITGENGLLARITSGATDFSLIWSCKQVTDIPITGALIVSAQGGATRNWTSVESGFNPNSISAIVEEEDIIPDAFSFTDIIGAGRSTVYTSDAITVEGILNNTSISIVGGTYSINGGAYTAVAGIVTLNDQVTVRITSSALYSTAVNTTLTIGGISDTYTVTTEDMPLSKNKGPGPFTDIFTLQ